MKITKPVKIHKVLNTEFFDDLLNNGEVAHISLNGSEIVLHRITPMTTNFLTQENSTQKKVNEAVHSSKQNVTVLAKFNKEEVVPVVLMIDEYRTVKFLMNVPLANFTNVDYYSKDKQGRTLKVVKKFYAVDLYRSSVFKTLNINSVQKFNAAVEFVMNTINSTKTDNPRVPGTHLLTGSHVVLEAEYTKFDKDVLWKKALQSFTAKSFKKEAASHSIVNEKLLNFKEAKSTTAIRHMVRHGIKPLFGDDFKEISWNGLMHDSKLPKGSSVTLFDLVDAYSNYILVIAKTFKDQKTVSIQSIVSSEAFAIYNIIKELEVVSDPEQNTEYSDVQFFVKLLPTFENKNEITDLAKKLVNEIIERIYFKNRNRHYAHMMTKGCAIRLNPVVDEAFLEEIVDNEDLLPVFRPSTMDVKFGGTRHGQVLIIGINNGHLIAYTSFKMFHMRNSLKPTPEILRVISITDAFGEEEILRVAQHQLKDVYHKLTLIKYVDAFTLLHPSKMDLKLVDSSVGIPIEQPTQPIMVATTSYIQNAVTKICKDEVDVITEEPPTKPLYQASVRKQEQRMKHNPSQALFSEFRLQFKPDSSKENIGASIANVVVDSLVNKLRNIKGFTSIASDHPSADFSKWTGRRRSNGQYKNKRYVIAAITSLQKDSDMSKVITTVALLSVEEMNTYIMYSKKKDTIIDCVIRDVSHKITNAHKLHNIFDSIYMQIGKVYRDLTYNNKEFSKLVVRVMNSPMMAHSKEGGSFYNEIHSIIKKQNEEEKQEEVLVEEKVDATVKTELVSSIYTTADLSKISIIKAPDVTSLTVSLNTANTMDVITAVPSPASDEGLVRFIVNTSRQKTNIEDCKKQLAEAAKPVKQLTNIYKLNQYETHSEQRLFLLHQVETVHFRRMLQGNNIAERVDVNYQYNAEKHQYEQWATVHFTV